MKNIKITLNGIKVDGEYTPCFFSIDDNAVCVTSREYGSGRIPAELGDVQNDTDSMTDYFDKDHVRVYSGSKFYNACYRAAVKSQIKNYNYRIKHCEKMIQMYKNCSYYSDTYKKELEEAKKYLEKWQKVFESCQKAA